MSTNGGNGSSESNGASKRFQPRMLINGELVGASDGKTFPLYNPATTEKVADVPEASEDDTNAAVAAAKAAFPSWAAADPSDRAKCLKKLAGLIVAHNEELALLEAQAMGKPVAIYVDALGAAEELTHYAESWGQIQGTSSLNTPGHVSLTFRQPYGVVAGVVPWNFPLFFFAAKSAAALITGNTVVLKSSEKAPLTFAKCAELVAEAGFPPGVFNILSGHGTPGALLAAHMDVRVLSFTGSTATGRKIQEAAAKSNLKKVILELGGKSPAVVFEDANLDKAVADTSLSIQFNSGQLCMATSRLYVQRSVAARFTMAFRQRLAAVKLGDPTNPATNHGPQADEVQYRSVLAYIDQGKTSGAQLALGGEGKLSSMKGYFVEPTVFLHTPEDANIMKEEIFGPVISINTFDTEEEAIRLANSTDYGLYASVYTRNLDRALRVAKAFESGYVSINCTSPKLARDMPFGGYKLSGQGREGWNHSLDNYLETKTVQIELESS